MPQRRWDFYLCKVDDRPGSIFLDLALADRAPISGHDTLYALQIRMLDPAEHGLGSAAEMAALGPVEDAIEVAAGEAGFVYLGHLRSGDVWQLTFMAGADRSEELRKLATPELLTCGRRWELVSKSDPAWSYYHEFLFPNAERMRWMMDRSVVEVLEREGDPLAQPRRVDHWIRFPDAAGRDRFAAAAKALGFTCLPPEPPSEAEDPARPTAVFPLLQIHREDAVDLESIHAVVMMLVGLAERHGGDYDGWETSVEK